MSKNRTLELWPEQVEAYAKICDIMNYSYVFANNTPAGGGKTEMCIKLAMDYGLNIVLVTERNIIHQWSDRCADFGINFLGITYAALRGSKTFKPDFRFLKFLGQEGKDGYIATDTFHRMAAEGILLVFDEYHRLKNDSTQHYAACELIHCIADNHYGSRVALLSASPSTSMRDSYRLIKLLGITNRSKPVKYVPNQGYYIKGIRDVVRKALELDPTFEEELIKYPELLSSSQSTTRLSSYEAERICELAYNLVFRVHLAVAAKKRTPVTGSDVKNGIYDIGIYDNTAEQHTRLNEALDELSSAIDATGKIQRHIADKAGKLLQHAKIVPCIGAAKDSLDTVPNSKVIIVMYYIEDLKLATQALSSYGSACIWGGTKNVDELIKRFQEDSDDLRVLVCQVNATCVGLNLDDRHGNRPRFMYIIPNHNFINLYQCKDRIYRGTTKSLATVRFVYLRGHESEIKIMDRLLQKKEQMQRYVPDNVSIKFPDRHTSIACY